MWLLLLLGLGYSAYNCQFSPPDGKSYDFSDFIREMPDYEVVAMDYVYRFNICSDTIKDCNGFPGIASQWVYNAGCASTIARQGPTPPVLTQIEKGLQLTYYNGDYCGPISREISFRFHCSNSATRIGLVEEPDMCVYTIDIYSRDACFDIKPSTSNYFWVYYVLAVLVGYFVLGWIFNKYRQKELSFIEAVPHSEKIIDIAGAVFTKIRRP